MDITDIKKQILKTIERDNQQAIQQCEQIKQKLSKNSDYINLCNKIASITIEKAKSSIKGLDITNLEREECILKQDLDNLLHSLGYSAQDLKPRFKCTQCNDTGILDNGEYCNCFNKRLSKILNNINNELKSVTFADCDKMDSAIVSKMSTLCNKFPSTKFNKVIFTGACGIGKTHLSQAMANHFINNNIFTIFVSSAILNQQFLKYHLAPINEKDAILNTFLDCEVLVIDDLGTENKLNNVTNEYLLFLINYRNSNNKLTIFTTNLSLEGILQHYDERIFSRLLDKNSSLPIQIIGKDMRVQD